MRNPAALLAEYTAALNRYDLGAVENMFAENAVYVSPGLNGEVTGRTAIMQAFRAYFADHTDQVNVDWNVKVIGNKKIQSDWSLTATKVHTGEAVSRQGSQVMTFDGEDRIARVQVLDI